MNIPNILKEISAKFVTLGAKAIIVGGSVRDHFLEIDIKDYDIEVYGFKTIEELQRVLKSYGKVKLVGKSFGVLKFVYQNQEYDFSFPRRERKIRVGHKGFDVVTDGFMEFKEAFKRRDFTINALGYDIEKKEFLDPFGGMLDMQKNILRHVDDKTFVEDPLRLYRGVQFCARFGYEMDCKTKELCKTIVDSGELNFLPKERVFEEMKKLLLKSKKPSIGFLLLKELGVLRYFPQLQNLTNKQWDETMNALDRIGNNLVLKFAALTYTFTQKEIESFIVGLTNEVKLKTDVKSLVKGYNHLVKLYEQNADDTQIRRLSTEVNLTVLASLAKAVKTTPLMSDWLMQNAKRLGVDKNPPKALLQGRDLISLGFKPSEKFSKILDKVYELQLQGALKERNEALSYLMNSCKE